jgi:hypothetical protein
VELRILGRDLLIAVVIQNMWWVFAALLAGVVLLAVASGAIQRRAFSSIASRSCAGRSWRQAFPAASKTDIRRFLQLFVDAFAISREHALKLRPDDAVMSVYRIVNPPDWSVADAMELESLDLAFKTNYGVDLKTFWRQDITLGELFHRARVG